jgi:outer membrane protein insertion porin family
MNPASVFPTFRVPALLACLCLVATSPRSSGVEPAADPRPSAAMGAPDPAEAGEGREPAEEEEDEDREEIRPRAIVVRGMGFWHNRMLKKVVWLLLPPEGNRPLFLNADFIEDAVSMVQAELADRGYLRSSMEVELELATGEIQRYQWEPDLLLPRPLTVRKVTFRIERGVRFYYSDIRFEGLQAMAVSEAESYFRGAQFLIRQKGTRIYSPAGLNRSVGHFENALRLLGYAEVQVTVDLSEETERPGAVDLTVRVDEGPIHRVGAAIEKVQPEAAPQPVEIRATFPYAPYSEFWLEDWRQQLRRRHFQEGYADTQIQVRELGRMPEGPVEEPDRVLLDFEAITDPGQKLMVGEVRFSGHRKTREGFLASRSRLQTGEPLNPLRIQQARYRLTQTGLFDSVRFRTVDSELATDPPSRDVEFELREARSTQLSLLAGYGSYELLRGGVEWEQRNLFGAGHNSRLKLVQAIRATRGEYDYSVPGIFNTSADAFLALYALQREEPEFRRREAGGSVGFERPIHFLRSRVGIRYIHERLEARGLDVIEEYGLPTARAASVALQLIHDRRDNALSPERGHHLFARTQVASENLGGAVNYQLAEVGGSYHVRFRGGRFIHLGFSHGVLRPEGDRSDNLPFNKRFFPGGESSIRGYQVTEASPRDDLGNLVGAETYWMLNVELEQALTPSWSVVVFNDTLGTAAALDDYPSAETLTSLGLGIRWKTPVGPVRLEYGYNLNPRPRDPSGTLLFSIGFPF